MLRLATKTNKGGVVGEFYAKYLKQIQNKIERLEYKKEHASLSSYMFEKLVDELRVLGELEEFLWQKLGD